MVELVGAIAKSLVDNPDKVEVEQEVKDGTTVVSIRVAPEDMGKVIGKQGRSAKAMRTIVKAAAMKKDIRVDVEIVE